jgi:hypothetical protein
MDEFGLMMPTAVLKKLFRTASHRCGQSTLSLTGCVQAGPAILKSEVTAILKVLVSCNVELGGLGEREGGAARNIRG